MQSSLNASATSPVVLEVPSLDDFDIALGCECADPSLQIERWMQEASGDTA
ncbi:MAG TPA: hypothetical protein VHL79_05850 [Ramlibacter sp.]|nr:hypothetical protein [Ramlibacter sp.]